MHLEITTKIGCSNWCQYCPQSKFIQACEKITKIDLLSFELFKSAIDKVPKEIDIVFSGMSEPFLNPEASKMVLYAYQKGHKVRVFTTLAGLELEDLNVLFETIEFGKNGNRFIIHLPSKKGLEQIPKDKKYLRKLNQIVQKNWVTEFHFHGQSVDKEILGIIKGKDITNFKPHNRAGNIDLNDKKTETYKKGRIKCDIAGGVLLPNGDVYLCCQDFGLKHCLGNINKISYKDLFKSQEYKKIIKGWNDERIDILCRKCLFAQQLNESKTEKIKRTFKKLLGKLK